MDDLPQPRGLHVRHGRGGLHDRTTSGSSAFLTSGGTTQLTTGVTNAQTINAPLVILNASGSNSGRYTFLNSSTTSAAALTLAGAISGQATSGTTILTFGGNRGSSTTANSVSGVISDGAGGGKLGLVVGSGWTTGAAYNAGTFTGAVWTFSANNTFTGPVTVSSGIVRLTGTGGRFSGAPSVAVAGNSSFTDGDTTVTNNNGITNRINPSASLTLGDSSGAGTFTLGAASSGSTHSQTLTSLTIGPGQSSILASATTGTNQLIFSAPGSSAYTRNVNGLVNISGTANGLRMSFTNAPTGAGVSGVSAPILVGAILDSSDFVAAASGVLAAPAYTANGASSLTAGANINVTGANTTLPGSSVVSVNSLRFPDTTQRTLDVGANSLLTVASGGILVPLSGTNNINSTITGGTITSGQGDLQIFAAAGSTANRSGNSGDPRQNSYGLSINSVIADNGSTPVSLTVGGNSYSQVLLGGANTYSGGTYLMNGLLKVNADSGLGSLSGTVTAVSGFNAITPTASMTFNSARSFVINAGATLWMGNVNTQQIDGTISGGGLLYTGVNGGGRLILTGSNSNFTGRYSVDAILQAQEGVGLSSNANLGFIGRGDFNTVGILETSGTFVRPLGNGPGQVMWESGNNGGFAAVGGPLTVNIGGNAAPDTLVWGSTFFNPSRLMLQSGTATNDVTFLNNVDVGSTNRTIVVTQRGSTKAIMSGTVFGSGGIVKMVAGTLVLSGSNTYQGKTSIQEGSLSVGSLNSVFGGVASSNLGAPSSAANGQIALGNAGTTGTLLYTGTGETTDRSLDLAGSTGGGGLDQSGSGLLKFTSAVSATTGLGGNKTLTLQGSTSGSGELAGVISNNTQSNTTVSAAASGTNIVVLASTTGIVVGGTISGPEGIPANTTITALSGGTATLSANTTQAISNNATVAITGLNNPTSLTKAGTGTWVLSGNNTYTGPTTVSAGVLSVASLANGGSSSNIGASTNAAGNLILGGGSLQYTGATVTTDRAFTLTASTTSTIDVSTAGTTLTFTGSTTATTGALTKAGAGTLALAGAAAYTGATAINAGTLQIGNGSTTGGLSASSAISIASGATLAFSRTDAYGGNFGNTITGSGGVTLLSGSLTFSTAKTYTGQTTVNGGVLAAGIANAFGSSAALAVNSGTVNLAGFSQAVGALSGSAGTLITTSTGAGSATLTTTFASGTSTFAGSIANNVSGTVAFTKAGAGTQILSGNNTYTGTTSVTAGTLQIGSGSTTGSLSSSSVITGSTGATLAFNRTDNYGGNVANTIGGGLGVSLLSGSLTLSATNTYTGDTSINAGTLEIASTGRLGGGTYAGALSNNGAFVYSGTNAQTLSGLITGSGAFTNNAASVLTLSGTMSLSGASNAISNTSNNASGRIDITGQLSTAPGSLLTLTVGATAGAIQLSGASNTIQGEVLVTGGSGTGGSLVWLSTPGVNSLSGATKITVASGNTLRYWSASVGAGTAFDLNGTGNGGRGALSFYDSGTSTLSGPVNLSGNSTIVGRNASLTLGGNITESGGARSLTISADGGGATTQVYTLSGSNSFSGGLTFTGGDYAGFIAKLTAGSATAFGSGPLALGSLTQATATAVVDLNGQAITVGGLSGGNLANANSFIQSDSGAAVLTVNQTTNDTFSGVIRNGSGSVALTKTGNATLTLAGSNSFSGNTRIGAGTLAITNANGLSNSTLDLNAADSGTISFSQNSTLGGLTGSRNLDMGTRTLSIGNNGQSTTYSGGLSNGALTKIGAGTLALSGSNSYTGATSISAGTLQIGNGGTSGAISASSAISIGSGATLAFSRTDAYGGSFGNAITGSGGVSLLSGELTLTGSNTYSGGTLVNAGKLAVNGSLASGVAIADNAFLAGSGLISGVLSGAGIVSPGSSPGILTAGQFDPSLGLGAAFEFTNFAPTYNAPSASVNDVLRLTNGTPFIGDLTTANTIDVYFNVGSIATGDIFEGGFFTGLSAADLLLKVQNAQFNYWVATGGTPTTTFNGVGYVSLTSQSGITGVTVNAISRTADFGSGAVAGSVTQFIVVPEPGSIALAGVGIAVAAWAIRRRRK